MPLNSQVMGGGTESKKAENHCSPMPHTLENRAYLIHTAAHFQAKILAYIAPTLASSSYASMYKPLSDLVSALNAKSASKLSGSNGQKKKNALLAQVHLQRNLNLPAEAKFRCQLHSFYRFSLILPMHSRKLEVVCAALMKRGWRSGGRKGLDAAAWLVALTENPVRGMDAIHVQ